jgi:hypothetical protein
MAAGRSMWCHSVARSEQAKKRKGKLSTIGISRPASVIMMPTVKRKHPGEDRG